MSNFIAQGALDCDSIQSAFIPAYSLCNGALSCVLMQGRLLSPVSAK
jgi:hypothetical protein